MNLFEKLPAKNKTKKNKKQKMNDLSSDGMKRHHKAYSLDNPVHKHTKTFYVQVYEMIWSPAFWQRFKAFFLLIITQIVTAARTTHVRSAFLYNRRCNPQAQSVAGHLAVIIMYHLLMWLDYAQNTPPKKYQ